MSNVLGTLFGDIAEAIRSKTGEAGTMKPAEFPDKIAGISVGGGSGGDGEWVIASGSVDGNGDVLTVTHGLGVIPDIVTVLYNNSGRPLPSETQEGGRLVTGCFFGEKMLGGAGTTVKNYGYIFAYSPTNQTTLIAMPTDGIENAWIGIRDVNARTFQLGTSAVKLFSTLTYNWTAYARK